MFSHIIESVEFLDKNLLYDVQVEEIEYKIFDRSISTNKWLRLEDWVKIYDTLKTVIAKCTSANLNELNKETICIADNIEIDIEKVALEDCYRQIFPLKEKAVHPQLVRIVVRWVNIGQLRERIKVLESQLELTKQNGSNSEKPKKDKTESSSNEYDPIGAHGNHKSEYVPVPANSYVPYKPTKFTKSADRPDTPIDDEPYSPKPVPTSAEDPEDTAEKYSPNIMSGTESSPQVPTYKPSAIRKTQDVKSTPVKSKTKTKWSKSEPINCDSSSEKSPIDDINRITRKRRSPDEDVTDKSTLSQDLFGSDDSDKESKTSDLPNTLKYALRKSPRARSTKPKQEENNFNSKKFKSISEEEKKLSASKDNMKSSSRTCKSKSKKSKKSREPTKPEQPYEPCMKLTPEELQRNREQCERDIEILKAVKEKVDLLNKPAMEVEILNLNRFTAQKLCETFDEFKPMLNELLESYRNQKNYNVQRKSDIHYLQVMHIINNDNALEMLHTLQRQYEKKDGGVLRYTNLFMELMLPEWVLGIFMKEFNLSRTEAIERMHAQEELEICRESLNQTQE